jgi:hypothetical protein
MDFVIVASVVVAGLARRTAIDGRDKSKPGQDAYF